MSTNWLSQIKDTQSTPVTWDIAEGVDTRIFRATSSTAAATAAKVATLDVDTGFALNAGVRVAVTFQYGNSATTPTLNVNSKGAKNIVTPTAVDTVTSGNGGTYNNWGPYETVLFTYNGTSWVKGATGFSLFTHTHGNLTGDGKITTTATIANGDKLVIVDSDTTAGSKITGSSITFDGSTTTKALTQKGTWESFNNYSHPTATAYSSGLYKITVDGTGHVTAATAVAKADITALGIPGSDTNTATAADNILDGSNSGTEITYKPYTSQQNKLSFDTSTTTPTGTSRLNLNGKLYATALYVGSTAVLTAHQNVTNNNISIPWDTETTIATIGSTAIKVKIPAQPTAADLGLSNAMHFIGTSSTIISDGNNENPTITGLSNYTKTAGDVVLYGSKEFVYTASNQWELLGDEGSYKVQQTAVTAPTEVTNKWVSTIGQNANGDISVTYKELDTSGTWSGNAAKLGTTTVGSLTKPIYLDSGTATECSTYAGGTKVTLNNSNKGASTASFYAPIESGTDGYVLIGKGANTAPIWYEGQKNEGSVLTDWITSFKGNTAATTDANGAVRMAGGLSIKGNIIPTDSTYNLGGTSYHWLNGYFDNIYVSTDTGFTAVNTGKIGTYIGSGNISLVETSPYIDFRYNKLTSGYTARIIADAESRIHIIGRTNPTDLTYYSRTIKPLLYNEGILYANKQIESGEFFLVNRDSTGGGYYVYSNNAAQAHLYVDTLGVAPTATTSGNTTTYSGAVVGRVTLSLGNTRVGGDTADGVADNARGRIALYGPNSYYTAIYAQADYQKPFYLPNYNGDMYAVHAGDNNAVGSDINPVYVEANGRVAAITYSLSATVNEGQTNTLAYYSADDEISNTGHYASTSKIAVNSDSEPNYNLYTNGTTGFYGDTTHVTGHLYLKGITTSSITNTTQIVFSDSTNDYVTITANKDNSVGRIVINPSTSSTTGQIILTPNGHSGFTAGTLTVNNSLQSTYQFYVNGTSYFKGNVTHEGDVLVNANNTHDIAANDKRFQKAYIIENYVGGVSAAAGGIFLWTNDTQYGRLFVNRLGTANTPETSAGAGDGVAGQYGRVYLYLGNSTPVNTATDASEATGANNARGILRIYSTSETYTEVIAQAGNTNSFALPKYEGTMYAVHASSNSAVGSTTQPVYIATNGRVTACTAYTGLLTDLSWTAGTSAGPTLSITVGGTTETATIPSASTSASGIVTNADQTFGGTKSFNNNICITATGKGLWLTDSAGASYGGIYDNGSNLWIGTKSSSDPPHTGGLYLHAGKDASNNINQSIWIYARGSSATEQSAYAMAYGTGGSSTKPVYVSSTGKVTACSYSLSANVSAQVNAAGANNRAARYNGSGQIESANNIWMNANSLQLMLEGAYRGKIERKKADGGGWAYTAFRFDGNDDADFAHIGVLGSANALTYMFIGANDYNGNNLRVAASGTTSVPRLRVWSTSDSSGTAAPGDSVPVCIGDVGGGHIEIDTNEIIAKTNGTTPGILYLQDTTGTVEVAGTGGLSVSRGLVKITNNSNTVTIGSQNSTWCHIYNSANVPFIFNKTVCSTAGDIGHSDYPWANAHFNVSSCIKFKYGSSYYNVIRAHNNGNISIGAASAGLYIGWEGTNKIDFLNGKASMDANANLTIAHAGVAWTKWTNNTTQVCISMWSDSTNQGIYSYGYWTGSAYQSSAGWVLYRGTDSYVHTAFRLYGAVWNDYAEYRITKKNIEPGRCVTEVGDDTLELTTERLQKGCEIVSDTFGFAIGKSEKAKTPTAASGRVLAYLYEDKKIAKQHIGDPVCSGPNGTVSIMTPEEEKKYPSRIIGTISAVPDYDTWNAGSEDIQEKIKVNGRIWIRIR